MFANDTAAQGKARIVNIASVHGLVASRNKVAYVAAKHGLVGLTKVVALENAEANITCQTGSVEVAAPEIFAGAMDAVGQSLTTT